MFKVPPTISDQSHVTKIREYLVETGTAICISTWDLFNSSNGERIRKW